MSTTRTRIARLTAASVLALGLGALGAAPASATYNSWAGSAPPESSVAGEDASPDVLILSEDAPTWWFSAEDGASPEGGTWSG